MRNQYANLKDQNVDQYIFDVIISGTLADRTLKLCMLTVQTHQEGTVSQLFQLFENSFSKSH